MSDHPTDIRREQTIDFMINRLSAKSSAIRGNESYETTPGLHSSACSVRGRPRDSLQGLSCCLASGSTVQRLDLKLRICERTAFGCQKEENKNTWKHQDRNRAVRHSVAGECLARRSATHQAGRPHHFPRRALPPTLRRAIGTVSPHPATSRALDSSPTVPNWHRRRRSGRDSPSPISPARSPIASVRLMQGLVSRYPDMVIRYKR